MNGIALTCCCSIAGCGAWCVIDLKIGKFTHADAGQMNLYLNYATRNT